MTEEMIAAPASRVQAIYKQGEEEIIDEPPAKMLDTGWYG